MAGLGWIDFSEDHRDRVFSVVDMLSTGGTIDGLGIGTVRDAIADWLFPGVSTIQTRPKYFILIPQILLTYLKRYSKKEKLIPLAKFLRQEEHILMHTLAKNYNYEEKNGVIGINVAKNQGEIARKASSVYWNGLKVHRMINTPFSLREYLSKNDLSENIHESHQGEESDDASVLWEHHFGLDLPVLPDLTKAVQMDLSPTEADYLRDKFISIDGTKKQEGNLLRQILKAPNRMENMIGSTNFSEMAEHFLKEETLPNDTRRVLQIALDFDFLMYGAHIRYNILLQQHAGKTNFDKRWEEWLETFDQKRSAIQQLNFDTIFILLGIPHKTKTLRFMTSWLQETLKPTIDVVAMDQLVKAREINIKGNRAKLISTGEYDTWVGIEHLQYRFGQAKRIIEDIQNAYATR